MLSMFVIAFLPRSKHLLISWLQSPSAVILEPKKIKSLTVSIVTLDNKVHRILRLTYKFGKRVNYFILSPSESESDSLSVVSDSLQPHGLYSPWNSPGQNSGVGSHSLLRRSSQPRDQTQVSHSAG